MLAKGSPLSKSGLCGGNYWSLLRQHKSLNQRCANHSGDCCMKESFKREIHKMTCHVNAMNPPFSGELPNGNKLWKVSKLFWHIASHQNLHLLEENMQQFNGNPSNANYQCRMCCTVMEQQITYKLMNPNLWVIPRSPCQEVADEVDSNNKIDQNIDGND